MILQWLVISICTARCQNLRHYCQAQPALASTTYCLKDLDQWTNGPMDQWTNGPMDHGNWQHWQFSILIIDNDMHQISKWMKSFVIVHVKTYIDGHTICGYPHTNMGTHKLYWVPTIRYIYDIEFLSCSSIFLTIKVCIHYIIYFYYQVISKRCKWQWTVGNWRWQLTVNY